MALMYNLVDWTSPLDSLNSAKACSAASELMPITIVDQVFCLSLAVSNWFPTAATLDPSLKAMRTACTARGIRDVSDLDDATADAASNPVHTASTSVLEGSKYASGFSSKNLEKTGQPKYPSSIASTKFYTYPIKCVN